MSDPLKGYILARIASAHPAQALATGVSSLAGKGENQMTTQVQEQTNMAENNEEQNMNPVNTTLADPEKSADELVQEQFEAEEIRLTELRAGIIAKVAAGENFDADAAELAALNITHADTRKLANASALAEETAQILNALQQIIAASKLEALLGEPVTSAIYLAETQPGVNGPVVSLVFNQNIARRSASSAGQSKSTPNSTAGSRGKHYRKADGTILSARDVVLQFAEASVLDSPLVKHGIGKWVTKPMYVEAAVKSAAAKGVILTQVD